MTCINGVPGSRIQRVQQYGIGRAFTSFTPASDCAKRIRTAFLSSVPGAE